MNAVVERPAENRPEDTNAYETPKWLFDQLSDEFGGFDIDAFADEDNAKCFHYFTETERSAFSYRWNLYSFGATGSHRGATVFCNPPYSSNILGRAVRYMAQQADEVDATVVAIIPPNVDTSWWHDTVMRRASEVRLFDGRLSFEFRGEPIMLWDEKLKRLKEGSNRGASCVVVFKPNGPYPPVFRSMRAR